MVTLNSKQDKLWVYAILPAVIINLVSLLIFGTYYALLAVQPALVNGLGSGQVSFALFLCIAAIEWLFALFLLRRLHQAGRSVYDLLVPQGEMRRLRLLPALLVFITYNALALIYVRATQAISGQWATIPGLALWQQIVFLLFLPLSAGFCEELIWRGYLIDRLQVRGYAQWLAILLAAISFALIHGIFLPVRMLFALLLGIIGGVYFVRQRNLLPLILAHVTLDLWTYGLSLYGS